VIAAYRGMGIGREIVKVLAREARRMGLKNVEVEFLSTNQAAIHTYQKAGFNAVGRIPGKVFRKGKLLDSTIMAREI
jgi:ribosomal protein S18 acetylase RimI-like enzyme